MSQQQGPTRVASRSAFPGQLETERLILHPPVPTYGQELIDAVSASSAELTEWMPARKPLDLARMGLAPSTTSAALSVADLRR